MLGGFRLCLVWPKSAQICLILTFRADLDSQPCDPVIEDINHDPNGRDTTERRTHLYKKKKNPVFWLLPFENCSTWLFRKSEVTYVLNIVSK